MKVKVMQDKFTYMEVIAARIKREVRSKDDYTIDDLFVDVNEIYSEFDEGNEDYKQVVNALRVCCQAFLQYHERRK